MSWEIRKFGDVVEFPPKVKLQKKEQYSFIPMDEVEAGRKYVGPQYLKEWKGSGGARFEEGDTLFARITPCLQNGKIAQAKELINGKGFGSTEFFIFRGIKGVTDTDFVYYLSINSEFTEYAIGSMVGASGRQRADAKFIGEYEFNLPPPKTQRRIADILSAYDNLIENNLKRIKLLEQAAQNIYKEWFVNLRFPGHENTPINEETGLPEGWEEKKIIDCEIKIGDGNYSSKYPRAKDFLKKGVPFFSTKEMVNGRLSLKDVKRISNQQHSELTKGHLKGGDVLLSTRGSIGKVAYIDDRFEGYNINAQLVFFRSDNVKIYGKFLYCQLSTPIMYKKLINVGSGSAQPQLPIKTLNQFKILVPNSDLQKEFNSLVSNKFKLLKVLLIQNQKLKAARDILLPRLMNRTIEI